MRAKNIGKLTNMPDKSRVKGSNWNKQKQAGKNMDMVGICRSNEKKG